MEKALGRAGEKAAAGDSKPAEKQPVPPPVRFYIPLNVALWVTLLSHSFAALRAPIQDCDETYNYWEPLHYLNHGSGLQTWEYSPEYSIRSWAYILIHALPTKLIHLITGSKTFEFYGLRLIFALICASTEVRLYSAICRTLNPRIGVFYLMIAAFSPGFFYASIAFLPSSFAMYTSGLGLTAFMDWHNGGPKTAQGIMWFGIGALLGWPFAGALILPFVFEDWLSAILMSNTFDLFRRYLDGVARCLIVLAIQVSIDAFFFHKLVIVPLRIVLYNVIYTDSDRGPDIFGTEPWHYYIRNLLLNFNAFFLLALASFPMLIIQTTFFRNQTTKQTLFRTIILLSPFYLWLAIFTLQPHKEERFMYPAYPFLALNAAIALHMLLTWLGHRPTNPNTNSLLTKIPARAKLFIILLTIFLTLNISLLRTLGTVTAYQAPLKIYTHLPFHQHSSPTTGSVPASSQAQVNVCHAKDWYRFPTSFLLPQHPPHRPKFLPSKFKGLLPGEFSEAKYTVGLFGGTHLVPAGMNDRNEEDVGKYIGSVEWCDFLVDSYFPSEGGSDAKKGRVDEEEPAYVLDTEKWEKLACEPFLDTARSGVLGRVMWVPRAEELGWKEEDVPRWMRRVWGEHCLLKRRER
jgi:alpha-1,2-mannosyltransferase